MTTTSTDRFVQFLAFLLLETGLFTKQQWAQFLEVTEEKIDRVWLNGSQMPEPKQLRSILGVLRTSDLSFGMPEKIWRQLAEIERLPLQQIYTIKSDLSWSSTRDAHTLAEFLTIPLTEGLARRMANLTTAERERVLYAASAKIREIENEGSTKTA